jgi:hypothetical protein
MVTLLAVLAAGAWLFFSGAILFTGLLPVWFERHFGTIIRDKKDLPLWAVAVEKLFQAFGLVLLVFWTSQAIVVLAAVPLLLVTATYFFSTYANYRVKAKPVLVVALLDGLRLIGALILVGLILGRPLV